MPSRCHFGDISGRAHTSHSLRLLASAALFVLLPALQHLTRSLRKHPAENSQGALMRPGFGLSAIAPRFHPHRLPSRLTSRSSRPRIVASTACFCATLARCRRPAVGRLNSSVRRQKSIWRLCFSTRGLYRLRLALLFGLFPAALLLRSGLSGALKPLTRYVGRLRKR